MYFEKHFFHSNDTYVHPTAIVGSNVKLEKNVKIGPYCILIGNIKIDTGSKIYPYVTIGFPAQDTGTTSSLGSIEIGKNCEIRECVTINASKYTDGKTKIGDNCYIMNFSHIAHDTTLENNVKLINSVNLGGHAYVEQDVMLMANSAMHQFCKIGKFSCLTPYSATRQDLPPFCMFAGQPGYFLGLNTVALKRANFSKEDLYAIKQITKLFYQEKLLINDIEILTKSGKEPWSNNKHVLDFVKFIKESKRGVSKKIYSNNKGSSL